MELCSYLNLDIHYLKILIGPSLFSYPPLTLPVPILDEEKKFKALKAFIKPFKAPQRSVKIKI